MTDLNINGIPLIDLSPFTSPSNHQTRLRTAAEFARKCHLNGCIGIQGHGIDSQRLQEAFNITRKLFALPYEDKMRAPHPAGSTPHRGYSGLNREQAAAKTAKTARETGGEDGAGKMEDDGVTDFKESYEVGSDENKIHYNIWLPEDVFPGFRSFTTAFFWELNKLSNAIIECMIMGLKLDEHEAQAVRALHTGHDNQLRLLNYPEITSEMLAKGSVGRLGAHTDWSSFTLLFQQNNGGLEFLDRRGDRFMAADPKEGIVYLNIGDMFMRLSNALHRVSLGSQAEGCLNPVPQRLSIPYFVVPLADGIIDPPASLVKEHGKKVYEPVTFTSYSEMMFEAINVRDSA